MERFNDVEGIQEAERAVMEARLKTIALIEEADPVLHDLQQQLDVARNLLLRLEGLTQELKETGG